MSQIIRFKESPDIGQFLSDSIDSSLLAIIYFMSYYAWSRWKKPITITEVWRELDPVGTHKNWRAVDVRNSNFSREEALELAGRVNTWVKYDLTRPDLKCCLVYDLDPKGKHNDHFHVQTHERTVFNVDKFI
jgi:hypothetical protein